MIHTSLKYEKFNFPVGEMHIRVDEPTITGGKIDICFEFEKNEDIIELLLFVDAIKRIGLSINRLEIPYVPFSRQDRIAVRGECFSLAVFAELINNIGAREVVVTDPHSDVTPALIKNCKIKYQYRLFAPLFKEKENFWLISPDAGASKKIYILADLVNEIGVVEFSKKRNSITGEITGVQTNKTDFEGEDCYIVDDICDGGRTFVEIAKILKERNAGKIILMISHGFFTKGIEVFDGLIDEIYTMKGRVK